MKTEETDDKEQKDHDFLTLLLETTIRCTKLSKKEREVYAQDTAVEAPYAGSFASLFGIYVDSRKDQDPFDVLFNLDRDFYLRKSLKTLTNKRYLLVIVLRFGLYDNIEHTLDEVGAILGVTRERVRQMQIKALRLLKHPSRAGKLDSFYVP